jgi:engulfment/cell motility protein 1
VGTTFSTKPVFVLREEISLITTRLVPSPTTEALAVVTSLKVSAQQPKLESTPALKTQTQTEGMGIPLKLALFNLQKYIKEEDFAVEFMMRGGMRMLVRMLERDGEGGLAGNSLAVSP